MSVLLRRLYSTKVLKKTSECEAIFVPTAMLFRCLHFHGMSSAYNRSVPYCACVKFVTLFASNWKSSWLSSILREIRVHQTCEQLTCSSFVLFFCFSLPCFKYFRTLVANIRATNFLGSSFLGNYMLPTVVLITKVLSALRAHLTKNIFFGLL